MKALRRRHVWDSSEEQPSKKFRGRIPFRLSSRKQQLVVQERQKRSQTPADISHDAIRPPNNPRAPSMERKQSLWEQSYERFRTTKPNLSNSFENFIQGDVLVSTDAHEVFSAIVAKKRDEMFDRQWTFKFMNHSLKVREQLRRIAKVAEYVKGFGAVITNIDPIHAGLPWAGINVLLTLTLNYANHDVEALDGIEVINEVVARYAIVEDFYLREENEVLMTHLKDNLIGLYLAILDFQATAACHFGKSTLSHAFGSTFQIVDWKQLLNVVKLKDTACRDFMAVIASRDNIAGMRLIEEAVEQQDLKVQSLLDGLQLHQTENEKILAWVSDVPFKSDHDQVRHTLGVRYQKSGQWFLPRVDQWLHSRESSVMWLYGTVGTGKSCAISSVVEQLTPRINADPHHLVSYFYVSQKQSRRSEPIDILRSLVAQVASAQFEDSLAASLKVLYDERGRHRYSGGGELTIDECTRLIIEMLAPWPCSTFIIDALDECTAPAEAISGLQEICARSNAKILISSRMNVEVSYYIPECHKICIEEGQESGELEAYVQGEVLNQRRRLLDGRRPDLEDRLIHVLTKRAQGMFIWVKLQLTVFFGATRMRFSRDVIKTLNDLDHDAALPETNSLYQQILDMNTRPHTLDRLYAIRALQWVWLTLEDFAPDAIAKAIAIDGQGNFDEEVDGAMVLEICSNLMILDKFGCCRLAHYSVVGFLLQTHGFETERGLSIISEAHSQIAQCCLSYVLYHPSTSYILQETSPVEIFGFYAIFYWPHHCAEAGPHRQIEPLSSVFSSFMDPPNVSLAFIAWSNKITRISGATSSLLSTSDKYAVESEPLAGATTNGDTNSTNLIFRNHVLNLVTSPPSPALVAATFGYVEIIRSIPVDWLRSRRTRRGDSCLHLAAGSGRVEAFKTLMSLGCVEFSTQNDYGQTPLHVASTMGFKDIVDIMKDHMSMEELTLRDHEGMNALHRAAYSAQEEIVESLVADFDPTHLGSTDVDERTPLQLGIRAYSPRIVQILAQVMHPKDLANRERKSGATALLWCCSQGEQEMVRILLPRMHAEDIIVQDNDGNTALHVAAHYLERACIDLLLLHMRPEQVALTNRRKETTLHRVIICGQWSIEREEDGENVPIAQTIDDVQIQLISHMRSEDLGLQDHHGRTVLLLAASKCSPRVMKLLLEKMESGQVYTSNSFGRNCLHASIARGSASIVRPLLEHKLLIEACDHRGDTPLILAARMGVAQKALAPSLLAHGANVNAYNDDGWSPLHFAAQAGDGQLTKILMDAGADIDLGTYSGLTVLHIDLDEDNENLLSQHLAAGANPNSHEWQGRTALRYAVELRRPSIVSRLLSKGANPLLTDGFGRNCIDWALLDPSMRDLFASLNYDLTPSNPAKQKRTLRDTILKCISHKLPDSPDELISSLEHLLSYNTFGQYLLKAGEDEEAHTAFVLAIENHPSDHLPRHPVVCDGYHLVDRNLEGTRYVCRSCADMDLCASCMAEYHVGALESNVCQSHEFLQIPRDGWEFSADFKINEACETEEQWLRRLAEKYSKC